MKEHGDESEISSFVKAYADGVSKVDSDLMEDIERKVSWNEQSTDGDNGTGD